MIILRLPLPPSPWKKSPPIDPLIPSLLVGFLSPVQTSLQMTLVKESFEESPESLDSELVSSSQELGDSSSGTKVPACVGENSGIPVWLSFFLKLNLIILFFIYHNVNLYRY